MKNEFIVSTTILKRKWMNHPPLSSKSNTYNHSLILGPQYYPTYWSCKAFIFFTSILFGISKEIKLIDFYLWLTRNNLLTHTCFQSRSLLKRSLYVRSSRLLFIYHIFSSSYLKTQLSLFITFTSNDQSWCRMSIGEWQSPKALFMNITVAQ
jgi:hypothetical protein